MLAVLGYLVLFLLAGLIGGFFYVESKRKREIEENKKAISRIVSTIKDKFKSQLNELVEDQTITVEQHNTLYRLANNFFIFQPIKKSSIEFCEFTFNNIIGALQHTAADKLNIEAVSEQVRIFIRLLPHQTSAFNAKFYRVQLPNLIDQFIAAKQDLADVDNQLGVDNTEEGYVEDDNVEDDSVEGDSVEDKIVESDSIEDDCVKEDRKIEVINKASDKMENKIAC